MLDCGVSFSYTLYTKHNQHTLTKKKMYNTEILEVIMTGYSDRYHNGSYYTQSLRIIDPTSGEKWHAASLTAMEDKLEQEQCL